MTFVKQEKWTEDQVLELPTGEHDYFERKSGKLFDPNDRTDLLNALAKATSAFANSGGGHLILGVSDTCQIDGVPHILSGRTTTRNWLEQKIPPLLDYRLNDFRVHIVERSASSKIPPDRDLIVIDVGDSALAPHQSGRHNIYYYRSAGRSHPAPHFYLELLRQRLISPVLDFDLRGVEIDAWLYEGMPMLQVDARFSVENKGRVAAYKWALVFQTIGDGFPDERRGDYYFGEIPGASSRASQMPVDDTILPGCSCDEKMTFGVLLRPASLAETDVRSELTAMLENLKLVLRLATESSPGEVKEAIFKTVFDADKTVEKLKAQGIINLAQK